MKFFFIFTLFFFTNSYAEVHFSSPFVQEVKFTIEDGVVLSDNSESPKLAVNQQLKYMFGILNEVDSGLDFPQLDVEIISFEKNEIHYKVSGIIAWDKKREMPRNFLFLLPRRGDVVGRTEFLNKYKNNCSKKPSSLESFWNYYRPHHAGCVLNEADFVKIEAIFTPAVNDSENLSPNYLEIFKDNTLEITTILTKDQPQNVNDMGLFEMQRLCGNQNQQECHVENFQSGTRILIHVFLVGNFDNRPQEFLSRLQGYLTNSDIISYNGHSGMGANIESWMNYYPIKDKNKYQILFFNSCDTFGYFRKEFLEEGNRQVILNATPNYFGTFATSNLNLINKLLNNADFNEILLSLPIEQHPLVLSKKLD